MATAFEALKLKAATQQQPQQATAGGTAGMSAFEALKQKSVTQQAPPEKPEQPKGAFRKAAEFVAPSLTRTLTKDIAGGEHVTGRDIIGSALEIGSFLLPAGAVAKGAMAGARALGIAGRAAPAAVEFVLPVAQKAASTLGRRMLQTAGEGAVSGALQQAGGAIGEGATVGETLQRAAGGAVGGAVIGGALPPVIEGAGKVARGLGKIATEGGLREPAESIMQRVARISKGRQASFEQLSKGESVGKYLVNRGVYGNVEDTTNQLFKRFTQSKGAVDDALASLPGTFQERPVKTALTELLKREKSISTPGAPSTDLQRVRDLFSKYNSKGLNMSEVNEVKRLFERNVKLDYVKQNLPTQVARANTIDSAIRTWQQGKAGQLGFKNIQELNRETMLAKRLMDDLGRENAGIGANNAITLTDWIMLSGGDPAAIAGFITKKALSAKGVQAGIAKRIAPSPIFGAPKAIIGGRATPPIPPLSQTKIGSPLPKSIPPKATPKKSNLGKTKKR